MSQFKVKDEVWSSCWIRFAVRKEGGKGAQSAMIPPETRGVVTSVFENGCVCDFLLEVQGEGKFFFTATVLDVHIKQALLIS